MNLFDLKGRVAYLGDSSHFISVAQVKFSVAETGGDGEH